MYVFKCSQITFEIDFGQFGHTCTSSRNMHIIFFTNPTPCMCLSVCVQVYVERMWSVCGAYEERMRSVCGAYEERMWSV